MYKLRTISPRANKYFPKKLKLGGAGNRKLRKYSNKFSNY